MPHIWIGNVTDLNESWHTPEWGMPHVWTSHETNLSESCHTFERVLSHIWISHVTHLDESCGTFEYFKSHTSERVRHIRMSHVTHLNESCPTYEWDTQRVRCWRHYQMSIVAIWEKCEMCWRKKERKKERHDSAPHFSRHICPVSPSTCVVTCVQDFSFVRHDSVTWRIQRVTHADLGPYSTCWHLRAREKLCLYSRGRALLSMNQSCCLHEWIWENHVTRLDDSKLSVWANESGHAYESRELGFLANQLVSAMAPWEYEELASGTWIGGVIWRGIHYCYQNWKCRHQILIDWSSGRARLCPFFSTLDLWHIWRNRLNFLLEF